MKKNTISKFSCLLVKESSNAEYFAEDLKIESPIDAVNVVKKLTSIHQSPSEQLWIIMLNTKLQIIGYSMASSGGLTNSAADCRDIFRTAILNNAHAVILAHNHPSGDCEPSNQDITATEQLISAGKLLGITVLDHIIVGVESESLSMREKAYAVFN